MRRWARSLVAGSVGAFLASTALIYAGHIARDLIGRYGGFRGDELVVAHVVLTCLGAAAAGAYCFWLAYQGRKPPAP